MKEDRQVEKKISHLPVLYYTNLVQQIQLELESIE